MPDRFPPLNPKPATARVVALPAPSLPWFEMGLTLAFIALIQLV